MDKNSPTRSVDRALEILDCFARKDEMILLELAEMTGLSPSTVLRILTALQARDYVVKDARSKTYRLGRQIRILASHVPESDYSLLKRAALPHMIRMNERYNEDVRLFVPDGRYKLCIEKVDSTRELRQVLPVGSRMDLVRGAAGKVILANTGRADRTALLKEQEVLNEAELEQVRRQGYATSRGEREEGLFGLSVPVLDSYGSIVAAISMSGPTARFDNDELPEKIRGMIEMGRAVTADWEKSLNRKA